MAEQEARPTVRHDTGDLRRLKWLGVVLPLACLIAIEAFRYFAVENDPLQRAEHVAIAAIMAIGVVGFALLMFRLIERTEAQVIRQNRELTAINAVSTAVQGELAVEQIIDAALEAVIERTGATEASVVVFARDRARDIGLERKFVRAAHAPLGSIGEAMPHLIDIPLARGTAIVGRMRLHLPQATAEPDVLTSATLNNIGHQLACSIEIGQLVADLQRRKLEGHGLYDVLLRISNHKPLTDTLGALVQHARDLTGAESAELCLTPASASMIDPSGVELLTHEADGGVCIATSPHGASPSVGLDDRSTLRLSLVSPEQTLGELRVARQPDAPFSPREFGFLHSLGELAVIAVTSARMREGERQASILAERERIAREMHDSLAQVLGLIHLQLRALRGKVSQVDPQIVAASLTELADIAEEAYRDVREAILGLRESSRAERGLFDSLRAYLERYDHQAKIHTTLETEFEEEPHLSPQAEVHIIRVIQEALTNVRKHAAAANAVVRVKLVDGMVEFAIEDDGHGFDIGKAALDADGGFGLHAMRERMTLIGGTLAIDSAPGRGTRVVARVPSVSVEELHGVPA
jgi:two-component system nitrate/nitrite sensor histidine kinase NarX